MALFKELKFECIHCGNCCCDPNTLVNVTYLDILQLKNGLKFTIEELLEVLGFYVYEKKLLQDELLKMVIPPIQTENGPAFVALRKLESGTCVFYNQEKQRCSIYSARPAFCKTFPFFYFYSSTRENNTEISNLKIDYTEKALTYCQGIKNSAPQIDYDFWLRIGKTTLNALVKNEKFTIQWNNESKTSKVKPTAKNYLHAVFEIEIE